MHLSKFSKDEISICQKNLCFTAKGEQAKTIGTIVTVAFGLLALSVLLKS
ncbi:hypothetical protein FB2170_11816 [Maribacter sp. HTCC2170]|nr:hypothetical protein FB2170_11816 [Maribacter sp. HTCC2170]